MTPPLILVMGRQGQLAGALAAAAPLRPDLRLMFIGRPDIDLADLAHLGAHIAPYAFDLVINAAAYTAVDLAEDDEATAMAVNGTAPGILAAAAAARDAPIIHLSSDYVFSGHQGQYVETDATGPINIYGRSKLTGELAVKTANSRHVIVRTAWVHGGNGRNFARTMLRQAAVGAPLRIVSDQIGSPTNVNDLAIALLDIATAVLHQDAGYGLYHLAGAEPSTWFELACAVLAVSRELGGPDMDVQPILTADYPTRAARPVRSDLLSALIAERLGIGLPSFRASLPDTVASLLRSGL